MSSKINSNLLKKNNYCNWNQFNESKIKEEISFYFYKNSVIYKILKKVFTNFKLNIIRIKLFQTNNLLHIFISYFHLKSRILKHNKIQSNEIERSLFVKKIIKFLDLYTDTKLDFYIIIQNVQKYILKLKKFVNYCKLKKNLYLKFKKYEIKYKFLKNLIKIILIVFKKTNTANLLSEYISFLFKFKIYKKEHLKIFKVFKLLIKTLLSVNFSIYTGIKLIIKGRINGFARAKTRTFQYGAMPLNTFNAKIYYANNTIFTKNGTIGIKVWMYERAKKIKKKMIFKKITSNTSSKRNLIQLKKFNNLIKSPLLKTKIFYKSKKSGRNNQGKITISHKGNGHKKRYRKIDFTRNSHSTDIVLSVEYDPNRTSFVSSLYNLKDQTFKYIITPKNLNPGNLVKSGPYTHEYKIGYSLPLQNLPIGSIVHNISTKINAVGKLNRAAGTYAKIIKKELNYAILELNSGEFKKLPIKCFATIGVVSNNYNFLKTLGKAGRSRWLNKRPTVRGVAMNPVDHPNGGGEGKTSGRKLNPWGK